MIHHFMCPNCSQQIEMSAAPVRGPKGANEAWVCLWCDSVICIYCYVKHAEGKHSHVYQEKKDNG
jgi:hypothetical protein